MAGITLSGTTLRCEDNANADAALDGDGTTYSFKDFALKDAVNCVDLLTSQQSYRGVANIQLGDGAGSALTTIKDTNAIVVFNASRGILTAANAGLSNRKWELGTKIIGPNGKASGRDGCKLVLGTSTFRGTIKLYACHLKGTAILSLLPGATGLPGDLADLIIEAGSTVNIGDSTGEIADAYNVDISLTGAASAIANWNVTRAEKISIFGNSQRLISTGGILRIRDLVLGGSPTLADMRNTGANEWDLAEVTWTGNAIQASQANSYINQWWRFLPTAINGANQAPIVNMPVRVLDKNLNEVLAVVYTDANGNITYGGADPTTKDCLKALRALGATNPPWEEMGPFTARYNLDGVTLPNVLGTQISFNWPRTTGAFGDQLRPVLDLVPLVVTGGSGAGKEEYRTSLA